jgi:type VI secretion system secreted protein VgrG
MPATATFRPPRLTPKPMIHGMQTALVVGPSGEEIYTDKYGRVKVQFYWDREGKKDDKSSCWIRVGHPWTGKNWGAVHIPRIGQEVLVNHLEGDPDRPLITGMVYNAETMPPYSLPDNKTQSGIKTRSSKDGGSDNFNELRFEDKKGNEEVYFHAEKNFNRVVENNDTLKVGFDKKDDGNQSIEIFNNQDVKIGTSQANDGSQTVQVFNNQNVKIGTAQAPDGSQTIEIWNNRNKTIKQGNETIVLEMGNRSTEIKMGNDELHLDMGNQTTKLDLGQSQTEAMQSIELKVGQSSIRLDQMGVTIKGMMISIEGQIMTEVKGMMTQIEGSAQLQAQGAITMIN